jgi:uncharacterized protein
VAFFSAICSVLLALFLCYESAQSPAHYRRLKSAVAAGDGKARLRFYARILAFEWASALLAFAALQFDFARLTPASLQLEEGAFGRFASSAWRHAGAEFLAGVGIGVVISLVAAIVLISRARRRARMGSQPVEHSRWQRVLPDFAALIPTTLRERSLFAIVAVSAGVCEEVVFRAWLLDVLRHVAGLGGFALVGVAAGIFGVAHYYQGIVGVFVTGALGLVFCGIYIATGTLLVPIVVHAIIDLRVAVMPSLHSHNAARSPAGEM